MKKKYTHFSDSPFTFDPNRKYSLDCHPITMKPTGLWLSDENEEESWKWFCEEDAGWFDKVKYRADFYIKNDANVLILDTLYKIVKFAETYSSPPWMNITATINIYWDKVKQLYSGIIISPYQWNLRFQPGFLWYYGWDCASGCIWDLSVLEEVKDER